MSSPTSAAASSSLVLSSSIASSLPVVTLALTTLFTPPPGCWDPIVTSSNREIYYDFQASARGVTTVYKWGEECYPPQFALNGAVPFYSPGACPSGFQIIATTTQLNPPVTTATCCPSGYSDLEGYWCIGSRIDSFTLVENGRSSIIDGRFRFEFIGLSMAWAASDLDNFQPTSAPLLAYTENVPLNPAASARRTPSSPTSTGSSTSNTDSGLSPTSGSDDGGLSTGAAAGIGVGAALGAILVVALIVWAIFARRKKTKKPSEGAWDAPPSQWQAVEKRDDTYEAGNEGNRYEMHGHGSFVSEMPDRERAELDSSWQGGGAPKPYRPYNS
ncbi:hypothetical protein LTR37_005426 [Vermiconidia calcicola]|uniref:Uncharacterized protein n=1 Tax=Vermiconidia calcicola TaxID=1690605 RepID=A0ACC3NJK3_9PEZI|nr:hypothetical protein LTR37_005426 [Vermiconidia calcicola]